MRNSATRLMKKIKDYDEFYEYIESIAPGTKAVSFIEFDALAEYGKEACSDTSQSCETCKLRYSSHCEKCLLNPYSRRSAEACVNCYTPFNNHG